MMKYCVNYLFIIILLCFSTHLISQPNEVSVYQVDGAWRDQTGAKIDLVELQDKVRIVAFVYTYCGHTCPVIVAKIKSIINRLSEKAKKNTMVTLVTLDPERDTIERVQKYMQQKKLDPSSWQVLVGDSDDVLMLSALFNVRYKPMGESDIAHSNTISIVDKQGVVQYQLKGFSEKIDKTIALIETLSQ